MHTRIVRNFCTGALLALFLGSAPLYGQDRPRTPRQLGQAINEILNAESFRSASWGVLVADASTGQALYNRNARRGFIPASLAKLYTTAAVLDQLGPTYTYKTRVYVGGPVEDGLLQGSVFVRGSGDPTISGRFHEGERTAVFQRWADSLGRAGIQSIRGDVVGDDDVFDDTPLGAGWSWDDLPFWYSAETSGLSFNDNCVDLTVRAQAPGMPAQITWKPFNTDYVTVLNQTRTLPAGAEYDEEYKKELGTNTFHVGSHLPSGDRDRESLTVTNPTLFFAHVFRESLLRSGLSVTGRPVDVDELPRKPDYSPPSLRRVATYTSPPLSKIVGIANRRSQNFFAEQLLKTLGAERPVEEANNPFDDELTPGSSEMGLAAAMQTLVQAGVDTSRVALVDGSGLSRLNLVTPQATVQLLRYMWNHDNAEVASAFYQSLPVGGQSGTLRYRFRDGAAEGVHAKTGTLTHVSNLSGYVRSAGERILVFAVMCDNHTVEASDVRDVQDKVVNLLARYQP